MESVEILSENTLPDGAWRDSFDKLLNQRSILRENNVIKRFVRASLNMNSSYENSELDKSNSAVANRSQSSIMQHLDVCNNAENQRLAKLSGMKSISTPVGKSLQSNPFRCTLSPIGLWELPILDKLTKRGTVAPNVRFNSTPMDETDAKKERSATSILKCSNEQRTSLCASSLSPLALLKVRKLEKNRRVRNVSQNQQKQSGEDAQDMQPYPISLKPGKWRKSLYLWRRTMVKFTDITNENASLNVVEVHPIDGQRKSLAINPKSRRNTRKTVVLLPSTMPDDHKCHILQICQQSKVLSFAAVYNDDYIERCRKIGEGTFGEIFLHTSNVKKNDVGCGGTVLKVIPIEGKMLVNDEVQKTFEQILAEIIITKELSSLSADNGVNITKGFVNLQKVRCVSGKYPLGLIKLWDEYDNLKESENDHPSKFDNSQKYIVLELAFSGKDLESFVFNNAEESYHVLKQLILTLAVAEGAYEFEHRDLHWGNVLVQRTDQKYLSYKLFGKDLTIATKGVHMKIIDYTLSRLTCNNCCYYNDLSTDECLFNASGDYQFDIYRMMRDELKDRWETFEPKTNIFWISYIIRKLLCGVNYKNARSKMHIQYMQKLNDLNEKILSYKSSMECAQKLFKFA